MPKWDIQSLEGVKNKDLINTALVWNHPKGILKTFNNLTLICSLGAGVDHLLSDPDIPEGVKVTRIIDPLLSFSMSNYIIMAVLQYQRKFDKYIEDQKNKIWDHDADPEIKISIGILGIGTLGRDAAIKLKNIGFEVFGFSKSQKKTRSLRSRKKSKKTRSLRSLEKVKKKSLASLAEKVKAQFPEKNITKTFL